jgi:penicillin V acylase-like amidase (Ntn superfamily)
VQVWCPNPITKFGSCTNFRMATADGTVLTGRTMGYSRQGQLSPFGIQDTPG